MATTKVRNWYVPWSTPPGHHINLANYRSNEVSGFEINDADLDNLASSGDIIQVICLPPDVQLYQQGMRLWLGQFDSNGTPTATFSVILTDGSTSYELIKDATIGRTATTGDFATPGGRAGDELAGFYQVTDSTPWELQIKLTAALATATSTNRWIQLEAPIYAVQ